MKTMPRVVSLAAMLLFAAVCSAQTVANLRVSPGTTSVYAEWTSQQGNHFDIAVIDTAGNTVKAVTVYDCRALLGGLDTGTLYKLRVTPWRMTAQGRRDSLSFRTGSLGCAEFDTARGVSGTYVVSTPGSANCDVMPVTQAYLYSYVMHWIRRSELQLQGAAVITGIDFEYDYTQPMTHATNCSIYMGHTTTANHSSGYVPFDSLTMVYEGALNAQTPGWNHWTFNRGAFNYDGVRNLVVVIVDNSGSCDGSAYVFKYEQANNMSQRTYSNAAPYTPANIRNIGQTEGVASMWRSNMRLTTGACLRTATCAPPHLVDTLVTANSIDLIWRPGYHESSWHLDYKAHSSSQWSRLLTATTDTSYSLGGLTPGTVYDVRLTAVCTDTTMSTQLSLRAIAGSHTMRANHTDTLTLCGGMIYDDGGPSGNYSNSQTSTLVLMPQGVGTVTVQGSYTGQNCCDHLYIYDGWNSSATQLCDIVSASSGAQVPVGPFTATNPDGVLTLRFVSDASTAYQGFELLTTCVSTSCPPVRGLAATNITQTGATLQWNAGGSESSWEVNYGGSRTYVSSPSYSLSGLQPATSYTVSVRPVCTVGDTGTAAYTTFTTLCGTITLNGQGYSEGFEGATSLPPCWQQDGVNDTWQVVDFATYYSGNVFSAHGGTNTAMIESPDERANLITPIFDISRLTNTKLIFWHLQEAYLTDQDTLTVLARSSTSAPWTQLARYTADIQSWQCDSIALNGYSTIQIAFRADCGYGYGVVLDDVSITGTAIVVPCNAPTGLTALSTTTSSATVSWTESGQFDISYKASSASQWSAAVPLTVNNYTFAGLTPATQYDWRVRKICGAGDTSGYAVATFTTQQQPPDPCVMPSSLTTAATTSASATVQWSGTGQFEVAFKAAASSQWGSSVPVSATSYTFTSLTPATQYDWRVRKVCSATNQSDWATATFTTEPEHDPDLDPCEVPTGLVAYSISQTDATIDWSAPASQHSWQLMLNGANIDTVVASHPVQLSSLAPATAYSAMVRALCDDGQHSEWSAPYTFTTDSASGGMQITDAASDNNALVLVVYPNPVPQGSDITVTMPVIEGEQSLQLYDMTGRLLYTANSQPAHPTKSHQNTQSTQSFIFHFSTFNFSKGAYFLKLTTPSATITRKIIVR